MLNFEYFKLCFEVVIESFQLDELTENIMIIDINKECKGQKPCSSTAWYLLVRPTETFVTIKLSKTKTNVGMTPHKWTAQGVFGRIV